MCAAQGASLGLPSLGIWVAVWQIADGASCHDPWSLHVLAIVCTCRRTTL